MAHSGLYQRKIVLGVDSSEHSARAFDCKYSPERKTLMTLSLPDEEIPESGREL